jgi:dihydroneopterin aldolase
VTGRLLVSDLALLTHCGVTPEERAVGQRVLLDVEMTVDLGEEAGRGGLEATVDYADVCREVFDVGTKARHTLLESLALDVAETVLARPRVREVRVRVTKPAPPIAPPVGAFSVEVVRGRTGAGSG